MKTELSSELAFDQYSHMKLPEVPQDVDLGEPVLKKPAMSKKPAMAPMAKAAASTASAGSAPVAGGGPATGSAPGSSADPGKTERILPSGRIITSYVRGGTTGKAGTKHSQWKSPSGKT